MPDDSHMADKSQIPTNMRLLLLLEEVARAGAPVAPSTLVETLDLPKPRLSRKAFCSAMLMGAPMGPGDGCGGFQRIRCRRNGCGRNGSSL